MWESEKYAFTKKKEREISKIEVLQRVKFKDEDESRWSEETSKVKMARKSFDQDQEELKPRLERKKTWMKRVDRSR